MALYQKKNYSKSRLANISPKPGDVFEGCNFCQNVPQTKLFPGVTGLTFRNCNMQNCAPPPGAILEKSVVTQVSRCAHLHPSRGLTCAVDCVHLVSTDTVTIDGTVVVTKRHYQNIKE